MSHPEPRPPAADGEREDSRAWLIETLQSHIYADATGLAPAVIGHHLFGFEQAADAILSRLTAAEAGREEARADQKAAEDQNDALHVKLKALAPHGSCACSYDHPGDTCMHHSPALVAALARVEKLEKALLIVDQDARDHIRSDEIAPALLRPHALRAVRAALTEAQPKGDQ